LRVLAYFILLLAGVFGVLLVVERRAVAQVILAAVAVFSGGLLLRVVYAREMRDVPTSEAAGLAKVSAWARKETPPNALFLTPTGLANFRISAERSLVGTWRDGTQLYFSAAFGDEWLDRVRSLEPGLTLAEDGTKVLSRDGDSLEMLDDKGLLELAQRYGADYILLKTHGKGPQPRSLAVAYTDKDFTAYKPEVEPPKAPKGVFNAALWNASEEFMRTTVAENIEKYRKADVTFRVMDAAGQSVRNLTIKADETKSAFVFGASLGFFEPNNISPSNDQKPAPARPVELQKAPEIFNGSMIPFSGKWCYIEPQKGKYRWSDMDKYVDYAVKNDWTLEFHHLSGILPGWVESMGGTDMTTGLNFGKARPELQKEFNRHCFDTVDRYADRIKYWQVVNEKYMMAYVPEAFKELQKRHPKNQFGISDCVRFWDGGSREPLPKSARGRTTEEGGQYKGADAVDWLIKQGVKPDFFSIHGHWPMNLWADPREMYNVIDYFSEKGLRVHLSEEVLQLNGQIMGPMRAGTLTPDLQGEYIVRFFTVAFSNPNVDMANYWGLAPDGWGASNSGLIDSAGKVRPAWNVLKKQITETWRSHVSGELSAEGKYLARVFHGTYVVTVTLANGKQVTAKVEVPEKPAAEIRLELDAGAGTMKVVN
jgi:GH35 family endo-1,4-beta-xylanase